MTTIAFDMLKITLDGQGNTTSTQSVTGTNIYQGDLTSLTYFNDTDTNVSVFDPLAQSIFFSDGVDVNTLATLVFEMNWTGPESGGVTTVLSFFNASFDILYLAPAGGNALPLDDIIADEDSFFLNAANVVTTGAFAPGQNLLQAIPLGDPNYSNVRITEDDLLIFGDGNDAVIGGSGRDIIDGGNGFDLIDYSGLSAGAEIHLLKAYTKKGVNGRDQLLSIEDVDGTEFDDKIIGENGAGGNFIDGEGGNDIIRGRDGADNIGGQAGDDRLFGDDGNDLLDGGADNDELNGGSGDDTLLGGAGADRMRGEGDNDELFGGSGDDRMLGGSGNDELSGQEDNDTLFGNGGEDSLLGGAGIDKLDGGQQDDVLNGGADNDFLFGGLGFDTFVFEDIDNLGKDRIKDWQDGRDRVDVSDFGFTTFEQIEALTDDVTAGLRIRFADDGQGNARTLIIENFTTADFDATDVILADVPIA